MARTITASVFCPECCEEAPQPPCCMYLAQSLIDGLYSAADLPNTLDITNIVNDSPITVRVNKSGSSYPFTFNYPYGGSINLTLLARDDRWLFDPPPDEWGIWINPCLITDESRISVKDTFSDTYTITRTSGAAFSGVVTRVSLCRWEAPITIGDGLDSISGTLALRYIEESFNGETQTWEPPFWLVALEDIGPSWFKYSLNSPVGIYSDPSLGSLEVS